MTAYWHQVDKLIYSGDTPWNWTDLDLSEWVGEAAVWVYLAVTPTEVGYNNVAFRPNGNLWPFCKPFHTYTWDDGGGGHCAGVYTNYSDGEDPDGSPCVIVQTGSDGIVEWTAKYAREVDVTLIGYVSDINTTSKSLKYGYMDIVDHEGTFESDIDEVAMVLLHTCTIHNNWYSRSTDYFIFPPGGASAVIVDWMEPNNDEHASCFKAGPGYARSCLYPNSDYFAFACVTITDSNGDVAYRWNWDRGVYCDV